MTTTWGNIAIILGSAAGFFFVRCYTSPNSHRWGMGSSHIAKVCHIKCHRRFSFRSDGNRRPKSEPPAVFTLVAYLGRWDLRCRNRNYLGRQPCYAHNSCGVGYGNRLLLAMVRLLSRIKTKGPFLDSASRHPLVLRAANITTEERG